MFRVTQNRVLAACVLVLAIAIIALWIPSNQAQSTGKAPAKKGAASPHYTVVLTEGHNLLVTDNAVNKVYFYTIDKDKPIGSPLKLRAEVDLTKVGQEEIKITPHTLEK